MFSEDFQWVNRTYWCWFSGTKSCEKCLEKTQMGPKMYNWIFQVCKIFAFSPKKPTKKQKFYIYGRSRYICIYIYKYTKSHPSTWSWPQKIAQWEIHYGFKDLWGQFLGRNLVAAIHENYTPSYMWFTNDLPEILGDLPHDLAYISKTYLQLARWIWGQDGFNIKWRRPETRRIPCHVERCRAEN